MGVVLSSYLIRREYPKDRLWGWFFLDDYAEWFGQKEERLADILALSPTMEDTGKLRLSIIISEAKYIEFSSLSEKRKDSLKQLRETLLRIADAIFGNPKRIDRDHWLSRLADLFISGIQFPASSDINVTAWRNAIREGDCEISLRGYSHIFISGPSDSPECSEMVEITDKEMFQEIFSRSDLKELVLSYFQNKDPIKIRRRISGKDIWREELFRKPSDRVLIAVNKEIVGDEEVEPVIKQVDPKPVQPELPLPLPGETTKPGTTLVEISKINSTGKFFACAEIQEIVDQFQGGQKETTNEQEWLKAIESQCRLALQHFQMQSKVVGSFLTPNAAILKFQGDETLTVEHVRKRQSEFLTTHKVNIIAAKAEPGVVSLTIARPNRRVLNLLDVWKTWQPQCGGGNHELLIGVKEEDGKHLFLSPTNHSPHTLIAGATGSGKSILMQNIILSIACTNTANQAQIVLIDPKQGVDYFSFEGLPHLQGNRVITSSEESISALAQLIEVMNCRYSTLRQNRVSNLFELNKKLPLEEQLPVLWIIHDEFAT